MVRYKSPHGDKTQNLYANGTFVGNIVSKNSFTFTDMNAGTVFLKAVYKYFLFQFGHNIIPGSTDDYYDN